MDVLDKAKELGEMIAGCEAMQLLKSSEAALDSDDQAKTYMKEYKQLQMQLVKAVREKHEVPEVEAVKKLLMSKQQELNDYEITRNYMEAKIAFDKLTKNINDVITFAISGEERCSPQACSSCSGCS